MDVEGVLTTDVAPQLSAGLQEGLRLDIAHGAADFVDHHVIAGLGDIQHPRLDLIGDVRDHLDALTEVIASALLGDDR